MWIKEDNRTYFPSYWLEDLRQGFYDEMTEHTPEFRVSGSHYDADGDGPNGIIATYDYGAGFGWNVIPWDVEDENPYVSIFEDELDSIHFYCYFDSLYGYGDLMNNLITLKFG